MAEQTRRTRTISIKPDSNKSRKENELLEYVWQLHLAFARFGGKRPGAVALTTYNLYLNRDQSFSDCWVYALRETGLPPEAVTEAFRIARFPESN